MGARGPVGKRSNQRHGHRTAAEQARTVKVPTVSPKAEMPAPEGEWHPLARDMFTSLADSGQSQFFEPSDWQAARFAAESTSRLLYADRFSAVLLASVNSMWAALLMTEADRRRLRIELEKPKADTDAEAAVSDLDRYRKRLSV